MMGKLRWLFNKGNEKTSGVICLVGLDNSGKTTLSKRLVEGKFLDYQRVTMGLNVHHFKTGNLELTAFDVGGQHMFRVIWESYVRKSMAVLYVVDSIAPERFIESLDAFKFVQDLVVDPTPIVLLFNKMDLADPFSIQQARILINQMENLGRGYVKGFEVSAKSGEGLDNAMRWMADRINSMPRLYGATSNSNSFESNRHISLD